MNRPEIARRRAILTKFLTLASATVCLVVIGQPAFADPVALPSATDAHHQSDLGSAVVIDRPGNAGAMSIAADSLSTPPRLRQAERKLAPSPQPATPTTSTTTPPATTTTTPPNPAVFIHPGVLVDGAQLSGIREHVAAGRQPWKRAFDEAKRSRYANLSYTPHPVPVIRAANSANASYIQSRGWSSAGDVDHLDDARAAYTHALLWSYSGNQAHADKAVEIMNAWSSTLTEIKFDQPRRTDNNSQVWGNGKLQAGWGGSLFARSAEIIRYSGAGWSPPQVTRFEDLLTDVYLPLTITNWSRGANWQMTLSEATVAIGVFTNDRDAFDAGIDMWQTKTPSTIYLPSDGATPIPSRYSMSDATVHSIWRSPSSYITGLQSETLRDLSHMAMGLGAMTNTAETAQIQGVALYQQQATRIVAGYETNAAYVNDYLDEVDRRNGAEPDYSWRPDNWVGSSFNTGGTAFRSGWEVAHNHYTSGGTPMPETARLVKRLRTNGGNQPALNMTWETLTHAS